MKKNKIISFYDLSLIKNIMFCVVGSNGKSTLVKKLANLYKNEKVLVSTTTKMFYSEVESFIFIDKDEINSENLTKNIYTTFEKINSQNQKIIGLDSKYFENSLKNFDVVVLECDGSKKKPLKGNREFEPVVPLKATYTVGVISFNELNKKATKDNVHNIDEFLKATNIKENDVITFEVLYNYINNENGLFKNSQGEKVLYLSHQDLPEFEKLFEQFTSKYNFNDVLILR